MVVKEINGRDVLLDSYWDGGYVMLDVENPASPTYIGDADFDGTDPLTGDRAARRQRPPGRVLADNKYFLAADEDFNPYRADEFSITRANVERLDSRGRRRHVAWRRCRTRR